MTVDELICEVFAAKGLTLEQLKETRHKADIEDPAIMFAGRIELSAEDVVQLRAQFERLLSLPTPILNDMHRHLQGLEAVRAKVN